MNRSIGRKMTAQERLDALFAYQKPDRVPIGTQFMSLGFNTVQTGGTIGEAYRDPEKCFQAFLETTRTFGWDPILQAFSHTILAAADFGGKVRLPSGEFEGAVSTESYPVNGPEDIHTLKVPDPETTDTVTRALRFARLQQASGLPVAFLSRSPFTMAGNMCGFERFLRWSIRSPERCRRLMQMALDHTFNVIAQWRTLFGADNMFVWMTSPGESNQLISPRLFERLALPFHIAYQDRLRALGLARFGLHICGDQNKNLPALAAAAPWPHPSILSFGAEVAIETAAGFFPKDIIYGNVDPVTLQFGSPEQVYQLTRSVIERGKRATGGFILGPGCELSPLTPPENMHAMTRSVEDFGWYG